MFSKIKQNRSSAHYTGINNFCLSSSPCYSFSASLSRASINFSGALVD